MGLLARYRRPWGIALLAALAVPLAVQLAQPSAVSSDEEARMLSDAIDFFTRITLKAEVIETEFDFVLDNHQDEERIFTFFSCGSEPDVVPAFKPAIANHREPAQGCVEVDRTFEISAIDRDVGPTGHVERLIRRLR